MEVQGPPALCQFLYRNNRDNFPTKENFLPLAQC